MPGCNPYGKWHPVALVQNSTQMYTNFEALALVRLIVAASAVMLMLLILSTRTGNRSWMMRQTFQFARLDIPPIINTPNVGPITTLVNVAPIWKNSNNHVSIQCSIAVYVFRDFHLQTSTVIIHNQLLLKTSITRQWMLLIWASEKVQYLSLNVITHCGQDYTLKTKAKDWNLKSTAMAKDFTFKVKGKELALKVRPRTWPL